MVVDCDAITCKIEFAEAVRAEGIDLNPHYKFTVSDRPYIRPYLADGFDVPNAHDICNRSFNLYLNEKYGEGSQGHGRAIRKVEGHFAETRALDGHAHEFGVPGLAAGRGPAPRRRFAARISISHWRARARGSAESPFRFLPVSDGLMAMAVNEKILFGIPFHAQPQRDLVSRLNFSIVNRIRVNNAGYVNDQDYDAADPRPPPSSATYVEASMNPYGDPFTAVRPRLSFVAPQA